MTRSFLKACRRGVMIGFLFLSAGSWASADTPDPFLRRFSNDEIKLEVRQGKTPDSYVGIIRKGDSPLPFSAHRDGDRLVGTFESGGGTFEFTAAVSGNNLKLVTGGVTRALTAASENPLTAIREAAPASHVAAARGIGKMPEGYEALATTAYGHAWATLKADMKSAKTALETTVKDLAGSFDKKAALGNALVDEADHQGGVPFTTSVNGHACHGMITATGNSFGMLMSVLIEQNEGEPAEWKTLADSIPTVPPLHTVVTPGGGSTLNIPDDWKIEAADEVLGGVVVVGPHGQRVTRAMHIDGILTPEAYQNLFRLNRGPAPKGVYVSPFLEPLEAVHFLNAEAAKNGAPRWHKITEVISNKTGPLTLPNTSGIEARFTCKSDLHEGERVTPCMSRVYMYTNHSGPRSWTVWFEELLVAPEATWKQDLLTMCEISKSYKVDDEAIAHNSAVRNQQIIENAAQWQARMDNQFRTTQKVAANQEAARHASAMNTVEMLSGYQKVIDTRTGTQHYVDYNNSDQILAGLNSGEGHQRYKAVHLADER